MRGLLRVREVTGVAYNWDMYEQVYQYSHKKMTITVCFDALGTCFSLEPCIKALDELLGKELRAAGSDSRMTIMDWVCQASCIR